MKNFKRVMAGFMAVCALAINTFGTVSFAEEIPGVPSLDEVQQMVAEGKGVNLVTESVEDFEWTDDMKVIWISDKGTYEISMLESKLIFAELSKDDTTINESIYSRMDLTEVDKQRVRDFGFNLFKVLEVYLLDRLY